MFVCIATQLCVCLFILVQNGENADAVWLTSARPSFSDVPTRVGTHFTVRMFVNKQALGGNATLTCLPASDWRRGKKENIFSLHVERSQRCGSGSSGAKSGF